MNNFDNVLDLNHAGESKFNPDSLTALFGREDVLSFWMAETDFHCPPNIKAALQRLVDRAYFPYQYKTDELLDAITGWFNRRHNLLLEPSRIIFSTGVMTGVVACIEAFTSKGDGVIIQPPVFGDFKQTITNLSREVIKNPLTNEQGKYKMNFDQLRVLAGDGRNKVLLLCSPHNPVGRVWTATEMAEVVQICAQTNTILISDEIHADVIHQGSTFTGALTFSEQWNKILMLGSPGKSFGIPGIADAFISCHDQALLQQVQQVIRSFHMQKSHAFTNAATIAGYGQEDRWMDEFLTYVGDNIRFAHEYLSQEIPKVVLTPPEGTYQLWLDFRDYGLDVTELRRVLAGDAGVGLNPGYGYGREGAGFARMNIACPRSVIRKGLEQLHVALRS